MTHVGVKRYGKVGKVFLMALIPLFKFKTGILHVENVVGLRFLIGKQCNVKRNRIECSKKSSHSNQIKAKQNVEFANNPMC